MGGMRIGLTPTSGSGSVRQSRELRCWQTVQTNGWLRLGIQPSASARSAVSARLRLPGLAATPVCRPCPLQVDLQSVSSVPQLQPGEDPLVAPSPEAECARGPASGPEAATVPELVRSDPTVSSEVHHPTVTALRQNLPSGHHDLADAPQISGKCSASAELRSGSGSVARIAVLHSTLPTRRAVARSAVDAHSRWEDLPAAWRASAGHFPETGDSVR